MSLGIDSLFPVFSANTFHGAADVEEVPTVAFFTKIRVSERKTKRDVIIGDREDQEDSGVVLIPLTVKRRAGTPGLAQALHQDGPGWI